MKMDIPQKEKLVIAYDAKRLFTNFTGLGNYSRTLLRNLQAYFPSCEFHLFTPSIVENEETAFFINHPKFAVHTPSKTRFLWRTLGMSEEVNELKPDIFHGLSHEIPFGLHPDISTVVTFHDLIYERYPEQFGWWDRNMYKLKYRNAAKRAHHIVAISKSTRHDLMEMYHIPAKKISTVYQSCRSEFMELQCTPVDCAKGFWLYVGSAIPRKGLLQLVIAYGMIPKEARRPLVIVGSGPSEYTKQVRDMMTYYEISEQIKWIERLDNQSLCSIYDGSYALIYPSIYEGFGIPLIESLSRCRPVITSSLSSLPEAAGPGALYVDPFKPEEIASAMVSLDNKTLHERLAQEGRDYVLEQFNGELTVRNMMEVYLNIVR
jgi:glycosyltransferase involved in cell wall biosynthesis